MSDTVVTETPTPTEQTQTASAAEPARGNPGAESERARLYQQYYASEAPASAPPAEEVAPAGTESQPPASASTAQVEQTPAGTSSGPTTQPLPPEVVEMLRAVQNELAQLKTVVKPVAPTVNTEHEPEPSWIALLREGRVKEAEDALASSIAKRAQQPIVDQAVARTREVMGAQADVERFVTQLRADNPELLVMESYITANAAQALEVVRASGKIRTTDDAVREYKKAVLEATDTARKLHQTIRGSGKTEAMTRNREVLSASTPVPTQVTERVAPGQEQAAPEPESMSSYFERRKAQEAKQRGMG